MMNSQRLHALRAGTFFMLILCVLLFLYMAIAIPNGATMWADKQWAEQRIREAQSLEQLQTVANFAASSIAIAQHTWIALLSIFMLATICLMIFLGWSLFMIRRIGREVSGGPISNTSPEL